MARPSAARRRLIYLLLRNGDIGAELPGGTFELRDQRALVAALDAGDRDAQGADPAGDPLPGDGDAPAAA